MKKPPTNIPASVRQRLQNHAKETGRPFEDLFHYYAIERFLYRLGISKHRDKVILKGALMFVVWKAPRSRATRDIDLLGQLENSVEKMVQVAKDVCETPVDPDGMMFDPKSVKGDSIMAGGEYLGIRLKLTGFLAKARAPMQIDIGFGDSIFPKPIEIDYPSILGFPAPHLKGYPRETVMAEKLHAIAKHGLLNTRMKDFYDIALLADLFDFDGGILGQAIIKTFSSRGTTLSADLTAFSNVFIDSPEKNNHWKTFIKKSRLIDAPGELKVVMEQVKSFLIPIINAAKEDKSNLLQWKAPGPWIQVKTK
ncbi:MAG: nucleotidyl transferase AbiEii/AbiGii toxin family protein [Elusimicrobia bacterium]|nr:nucleotidyl transferase AbiEii/AbiGii toxin family protein [Candidatus Obscuribacterium magneticum]MCB4755463.1 nucleotidyl transferase AbiEii/AbiGii toxin family protein [Candidatus Obscuribacterium magneticum]